jgi:K+-transporting ATPase KdpF subunit
VWSLWACVTRFWWAVKKYEVYVMNYVTAVVAAFLFVYLLAALIRPEWF